MLIRRQRMPSFGRHLLSVCHVPKDRGQLWEQGAQKGELMGYASSLARKQGQCDDGGGSSGRRDTARWPSRSCGRAGSVEHPQVRVVSSVVPEPWRLGDRVTLAPFPGRLRTRGGAEVPGPLSGFRLSALRARWASVLPFHRLTARSISSSLEISRLALSWP